MEKQKNENNIVLEMKRLLGRMMVQVDYMYRNDREMSRLDLDIMMERTREFYELLCDYQADNVASDVEEDEHVSTEINEGGELINHDVELEIEKPEEVLGEPESNEENDDDDISMTLKPEDEKAEDEDEEEDWEDEVFHVDTPVADKPEDNSLAARLQRTPVTDIRMAMGINDKVMIINDLFMGSVERYNKAIDALNDFPTLSGAKVYMSELQIELQWDTESQAYKMLNDLVERRFI